MRHTYEKEGKHVAHYLDYAIDAEGRLAYIDNVPNGNGCGCFCPACGEPLTAKNGGARRIHHFAHQSGTECRYALEAMLHVLAKEKFREAFLSKSEFRIEFEHTSHCSDSGKCIFVRDGNLCAKRERRSFNLKEFYDSCEQETAYSSRRRRSDLKIFSSARPERPPVYLEFCTEPHNSERLHHGSRTVEIGIDSEEDIERLLENGIVEPSGVGCGYVRFYGFRNKDYENRLACSKIYFSRYILHQSGKGQLIQDECECRLFCKRHVSSLMEICVHTLTPYGIYDKIKYIGYQKFHIPNCTVCKNYVSAYVSGQKICRLYKRLQLERGARLDTSRARSCPFFEVNRAEMETALKQGTDEKYTEFY